MAIIPSGWTYYDASENKRLTAGATMPTPAENDEFFGVTSSGATDYSKLVYIYCNERTMTYPVYTTDLTGTTFTIPPGWAVAGNVYSMSNAIVESTIAGAEVVSISLSDNSGSIKSFNIPSTVVAVWVRNNDIIENITGQISNNLKYFYCQGASSLKSIPSMEKATNLINGIRMFENCIALKTIPALPPNIKTLYCAFNGCQSLTEIADIPSTVQDLAGMCMDCSSLTIAPTNNSTVVRYVQQAFMNCINLIDASNFILPNTIENGWEIFRGCTKLITPPPAINGTRANYNGIFRECSSLNTVPTFSNNISQLINAFRDCTSLVSPPEIKHIDNCEMGHMFYGCTSLTSVPVLPKTILNAYYMFYNCVNLTRISMIIPANANPPALNYMFAGCTNLTGIIWRKGTFDNAHNQMFADTTKTIIIDGDVASSVGPGWIATANNHNVYVGVVAIPDQTTVVRSNLDGTLNDKSEYVKFTISFNCPVIENCKIYVPKVYVKNNQQQPLTDWVLTYTNSLGETVSKTILNSTDIQATRIEANELIESGIFETYFEIVEDNSTYIANIPTSCDQCPYDYNDDGTYKYQTYYWNGTPGRAIFTGDTYIFDATPNGKSFKIGGAINEEEEHGFIVGNRGLPLLADQYPSTFNGPVTMASIIDLELPNYQIADTTDKKLYDIIRALGWSSDVLSQ